MKILLAVDGSRCTKRMLAHLVTHEAWSAAGHEYTVFHGVPPLPHRAAAFASPAEVRAFYEEDAQRVLGPVRLFLQRHGIEAVFLHKVCRPAREIVRLATARHIDLVMMGSHGRSRLGGVVMGSVTTQVLALGKTPVLVFR